MDLQRVGHDWANNTPFLINSVLDSYVFLMCFLFLLMTSQLSIYRNTSINSVQLLRYVWFFVTQWTTACQASLSITNSWSMLKLTSIELMMPSNHLIFCCPLLLPPSILPCFRVFSSESFLHIRWPKYWSFSVSTNPSNEYSGLFPLGWTGLISLQSKGLSRVFFNYTVEKH